MATYKVIQDIEAEDKLVGPLSLRQFIYGGIAGFCGYLSFIAIAKNVAFLLIIFAPLMFFTAFFAIPWSRNQPTEVWALAKVRFWLKPRRRIWDQSGVKNLVNITAPKPLEKVFTNGLTQTEVHSRLAALANTLDSRGWVVKNVNTNLYDPSRSAVLTNSDRLIDLSGMPQEVSSIDITAGDDMLDEVNNPVAQKLDQLVSKFSKSRRQQLLEHLKQLSKSPGTNTSQLPTPTADYWFLNQPLDLPAPTGNNKVFTDSSVVVPSSEEESGGVEAAAPTQAEEAFAEKIKENREHLDAINNQHLKVIQPLNGQLPPTNMGQPQTTPLQAMTPPSNPAKMVLATNNDLSVATIGRIANKQDGQQAEEVVISLHKHDS